MIHWINVVNDGLMMEMDIYSDVTLTHPPSVFVLLNTLHNNMDFVLRSCHERCRLDNLYSFTCKSETCSLHFIRPGGMVGRQRREQLQMLASAFIPGQLLLDYPSIGQPRWEKNKLRCRERNRNILSEQTGRCIPIKLYNYDLIKRRRTTLLLLLLFSFSVVTQLSVRSVAPDVLSSVLARD